MRIFQEPKVIENTKKQKFQLSKKKLIIGLLFIQILSGFLFINYFSKKMEEKQIDLIEPFNENLITERVAYGSITKNEDDLSHIYFLVIHAPKESGCEKGDLVKFNSRYLTQEDRIENKTYHIVSYKHIWYRIAKKNVKKSLLKQ